MRISYSALETYLNCPLKYKFQNIDKIKEPKSKEAVFGTLIHSVMNFIHTPSILSPTLEQAMDYFSRNWNSQVWESELEERAAFSQGVDIIRRYYQKNDIAKANIVSLESHFTLNLKGNIISGIIDRIDKTDEGYEIIDYKTTKKMPSQEKVDNNIQLSLYLKAFLSRYPKEVKNLDKIYVSLYYLKHGVKLTSQRTLKNLEELDNLFLDIIKKIEKGYFQPNVSPLCDWCGYQKYCPMWKHKFKEERKIDSQEINQAIIQYIEKKSEITKIKFLLASLQEKISRYMDQEGVERVFSEEGIITRTIKKTYKYDEEKIREILEPLRKWNDVLKFDEMALKNILETFPPKIQEKIEMAKKIDKESKTFNVKKK